MKQKDITLVVVVVLIAAIFSYLFSNVVIASPKNRQEKVEVVDVITPEFVTPDTKYFNSNSFDPTQVIHIGDTTNKQPFNGTNSN
jgi:hypothetical protein